MQDADQQISFYQLLDLIQKKSGLYLPRKSIFDFQAFYYGYNFARHQLSIPETEEEKEFGEFLEWVRETCPIKTNHSWANLLFFYASDEREALDKFFELFKDFKEQRELQTLDSDQVTEHS